jgi:hypothetical protein
MEAIHMGNVAEWIRKAGREQRIVEFKCPLTKDAEFFVKISYASKFILNQIRDASKESSMNYRTRTSEEHLNDDKMRREYARQIIRDWRGLTGAVVRQIVPGSKLLVEGSGIGKDTDLVPYDIETAISLLEVSIEFENWVLDTATNIENFSQISEQKEKEYSNLS